MNVDPNALDLAWKSLAQGRFFDARQRSDRVLQRQPDNVSAIACRAMASWQEGGDVTKSIAELRRATTLAPEIASLWHNLATLEASNGDGAAAAQSFGKAIALKPDDVQAFYGLSQNSKFAGETDVLRAMVQLYEGGALPRVQREFLCFGLAKAYSDLGDHAKAMAFCLEANSLVDRPYDPGPERQALAELRAFTARDALRGIADSGHPTTAPLFIVGMPRSGTTLIEAILARHPDVHGTGETTNIPNVEQRFAAALGLRGDFAASRHHLLSSVPSAALRDGADWILSKVSVTAPGRFTVFTDKQLDNVLRLGLIAKIFPHARVIYARRHPLDTALSNLFVRFGNGQGFSFRQDLLGERIHLVSETMALWKQSIELPILDVSYERLVADSEAETRRIIRFAGLAWSDACLTPQQLSRRVLTASQWQVRQPIFTTSSGRWRHYRGWLDPLVAAMGGEAWLAREVDEGLASGAAG